MRSATIRAAVLVTMSLVLAPVGPAVTGSAAPVTAPPSGAVSSDTAPSGTMSDDAYAPGMLAAMERDLGLDGPEATELLEFQADAAARQETLAGVLGEAYAGAWIDPDRRTLHVGVTDGRFDDVVRELGARPERVRWSEARQHAWLSSLEGLLDGDRAHQAWVDPRDNRIVVDLVSDDDAGRAAPAEVAAAVRDAGVPGDAVRFTRTGHAPRTLVDVFGGNPYFIDTGNRCSVGFPTTRSGFLTAGHCGPEGATTRSPDGVFRMSRFPVSDMAWVEVGAGNDLVAAVNDYAGSSVNVAGSLPAVVGSAVCRSGATTGWRCGTLLARNVAVNFPAGLVSGLLRSDACAEPGDSGGSLIAGHQAQGMTSGGTGTCVAGGITYYQPVNEALEAAGVSLLTRSGPPVAPGCSGMLRKVTETLAPSRSLHLPSANGFSVSRTGTVAGCVDGPAGTDFGLFLQRLSGARWVTVARSTTPSPDEHVTYQATEGTYRWMVRCTEGGGTFTAGWIAP